MMATVVLVAMALVVCSALRLGDNMIEEDDVAYDEETNVAAINAKLHEVQAELQSEHAKENIEEELASGNVKVEQDVQKLEAVSDALGDLKAAMVAMAAVDGLQQVKDDLTSIDNIHAELGEGTIQKIYQTSNVNQSTGDTHTHTHTEKKKDNIGMPSQLRSWLFQKKDKKKDTIGTDITAEMDKIVTDIAAAKLTIQASIEARRYTNNPWAEALGPFKPETISTCVDILSRHYDLRKARRRSNFQDLERLSQGDMQGDTQSVLGTLLNAVNEIWHSTSDLAELNAILTTYQKLQEVICSDDA